MFSGVITAIVTPFRRGNIDEASLTELINRQIRHRIKGIVACGTTGESATLSMEEHVKVVEIAVRQVRGRVPVIAGCGSNSTEDTVFLTRQAKQLGADGALIVNPYYNKPTQTGLLRHFEKVAKEVEIPIVLYNIPSRTGVNMAPATVAKLSQIPHIKAIKEATGSIDQAMEILRLSGNRITVLSGDDAMFLPLLAIGAKGIISVTSNVVPRDVTHLYNAFIEGRHLDAKRLNRKLWPLIKAMFFETNPIPVKTALAKMGLINDEMRLPLCSMTRANRKRLREVMTAYGLLKGDA